jgi:hypothetical protein
MLTTDEIRQLKEWLRQLKWKSVEKDNMEFEVRTTCWVKDAIDKFANTET